MTCDISINLQLETLSETKEVSMSRNNLKTEKKKKRSSSFRAQQLENCTKLNLRRKKSYSFMPDQSRQPLTPLKSNKIRR